MNEPLKFYFHPLASFCHKVLIALYENDTPFEPHIVDFGNEASKQAFLKIWPIGKFPVLRDEARDRIVPESSIIIEYLAQHYPGKSKLVFDDPDMARQTRMRDRFYDLYVHAPMQKVVADKLRPAGKTDPYGVEEAKAQIEFAYGLIEQDMKSKTWAMGEEFTMADCAAAPSLFFANYAVPLGDKYKNTAAYLERLCNRPSYARTLAEAQPYMKFFPLNDSGKP